MKDYTSLEQLPLMLDVSDVQSVMHISRAGSYQLLHSEHFPSIKVGKRILVPRDKFLAWLDRECADENA